MESPVYGRAADASRRHPHSGTLRGACVSRVSEPVAGALCARFPDAAVEGRRSRGTAPRAKKNACGRSGETRFAPDRLRVRTTEKFDFCDIK